MPASDHSRLDGAPAGWNVGWVDETGSTNTDLLAAAGGGAPDRTVLAARHQTAGRGRLDRRWDAPPGTNLLVSILLRDPGAIPNDVTRRVGLAAAAAAHEIAGVDARLKWPNDVVVDDRKLAGILAQRSDDGVVVGLGMNVRWAPDGAAMLGPQHSPDEVLHAVLRAFDRLPADVHDAYRSALCTLGRRVRVELPTSQIVGTATDVDRDGRLVVLDECAITHRVDVGDVVHLRPT